ncbi:hypothetical protein F971_01253 [Acinetobacter vivianii]|uniref:Uncharacterized protein n=1 Tax=Acinetobacter vivianii TaxID=1776742 RepID=N8V036_9GAMM|nr:helix-turn-helix domain-containing protein [Acinetobacter vivianii]ENU93206.1 hypothetical protein F971_01253 [Acinetobacter vivianii]
MLDKKFLATDEGKKRLIAYKLHVIHGIYHKDIAILFGCSESTTRYWIKNLKQYHHLKDFQQMINDNLPLVEEVLKNNN